jgi:hypothetical protein
LVTVVGEVAVGIGGVSAGVVVVGGVGGRVGTGGYVGEGGIGSKGGVGEAVVSLVREGHLHDLLEGRVEACFYSLFCHGADEVPAHPPADASVHVAFQLGGGVAGVGAIAATAAATAAASARLGGHAT